MAISLTGMRSVKVVDFGISAHHPMQSFVRDAITGQWYVAQLNGTTDGIENLYIYRCSPDGQVLDKANLVKAGHGNSITIEHDGGNVYLWFRWTGINKPVRWKYSGTVAGKTITSSHADVTQYTSLEPSNTSTAYYSIDEQAGRIASYRGQADGTHYLELRNLADYKTGTGSALHTIDITDYGVMQGFATVGDQVLVYRGAGYTSTDQHPPEIRVYDWTTGAETGRLDVSGASGVNPGDASINEAEGIYVTPEGTIMHGLATGLMGTNVSTVYRLTSQSETVGEVGRATLVLDLQEVTGEPMGDASVQVSYDRTVRYKSGGVVPALPEKFIPLAERDRVQVVASDDPDLHEDSANFRIVVSVQRGYPHGGDKYFAMVSVNNDAEVPLSRVLSNAAKVPAPYVNVDEFRQAAEDARDAAQSAAADTVALVQDDITAAAQAAETAATSATTAQTAAAASAQAATDAAALVDAPAGTAIDAHWSDSVRADQAIPRMVASPRSGHSPNSLGGHALNKIAPDVSAGWIGGGGAAGRENVIGGDPDQIGDNVSEGSAENVTTPGTGADYSIIPGGYDNVAGGLASVIIGYHNGVAIGATHGTVGGGSYNRVTGGDYNTISGGTANKAGGQSNWVGGRGNTATNESATSLIAGINNKSDGAGSNMVTGSTNTATGSFLMVAGAQNVVTGTEATVFGRSHNVTGRAAAVFGNTNTAAGAYTLAAGQNTSTPANYAVAAGNGNTASGVGAVALGQGSTASGIASQAIGQSCQAQGVYSVAQGRGAVARTAGMWAFSSQERAAPGDTQMVQMLTRVTTTNATLAILGVTGGSTGYAILEGQSAGLTIQVIGRDTATGDSRAWRIEGLASRNAGGSSQIVGTPVITDLGAASSTSAWTVALTANSSTGAVLVRAQGEAGKTIQWVASITAIEVMG